MELQQHKVKLIVAAVLLYIFLVVANLPAIQIVSRVPLPTGVSISGVKGSLWNGSVRSVIVDGIQVENINWDLHFFPLLVGSVNAEIHAGDARQAEVISFDGNVSFSVFSQAVEMQDAKLFLPTHMVLAQVPLPIPVRATGRFYLDAGQFSYSLKKNHCTAITAKGGWNKAAVSGSAGMIDFGQFDANISCVEDNVQVEVMPDNLLNLEATALLNAQGQIRVKGRFNPSDDLPKEVHQAASLFGRPDSQGYYSISM